MIAYKVSDLIKQAKSKADLQNSAFITHSDDVQLVNDAWVDLYQKAINAGEKYFINSFDVMGSVELPDDFFELESIYDERGVLISRRKPNEHNRPDGYEIVNGVITVFTNKRVTVNYWVKPETLTFPAPDVPVTTKETVKAVKGNKLYSDHYVYDVDTRKETSFTTSSTAVLYQVFNDYIVLKDGESYLFYDIETFELVHTLETENRIPVMDVKGFTYIFDTTEGKLYSVTESLEDEGIDVINTDKLNIFDDENNCVFGINGTFNYVLPTEEICYTNNKNYIEAYNLEEENHHVIYSQRGFLMSEDIMTGYGIYFNGAIKTVSDDTLLDYPSHLFYSVIAYRLAMNYKIKQNEDATALTGLYEDALLTYLDTLSQDSNEYVRIKNVYGGF